MTKMTRAIRIGIDASAMLVQRKHGYENYVRSLLLAMADLGPELDGIRIFLYFHAGNPLADPREIEDLLPIFGKFKCRVYRLGHLFGRLLPVFAWHDRLDWLHLPVYLWSNWYPCPVGVTIHDTCGARLLCQPGLDLVHHEESARNHDLQIRRLVSAGSAYITVSESVARDLGDFYGVPERKITVVHHGVDPFFRYSPTDAVRVKARYDLDGYVLDVNVLQVRKNHRRLLEAFTLAKASAGLPHHLVLVGRKGWGADDVLGAIEQFDLYDCVHYLDYVSRENLRGLYSGAELVVNPSICEGFGLPLLEAMACGVPVIASHASSFPEVGRNAVRFFDPLDTESIARTIVEGLTNSGLRNELKIHGQERVKAFSWEQAARQTVTAYRHWCQTTP